MIRSPESHPFVSTQEDNLESLEISSNNLSSEISQGVADKITSETSALKRQLELLKKEQSQLEAQRLRLEEFHYKKQQIVERKFQLVEQLNTGLSKLKIHHSKLLQQKEFLDESTTQFLDCFEKLKEVNPQDWSLETFENHFKNSLLTVEKAETFCQKSDFSALAEQSNKARKNRQLMTHWSLAFKHGFAFHAPILIFLTLLAVLWWVNNRA